MSDIDEILALDTGNKEQTSDPEIAEIVALDPSLVEAGSKGIPEPNLPMKENESYAPWREVIVDAFSNAPKSAWNYAKDLASSIYHIKDTAKGVKDLAASVGSKFVPGKQKNEELIDSVIEMYKQRYESPEAFKKAFAEDPMGPLTDLSTAMMIGGGLVSTTGKITGVESLVGAGKETTKFGAKLEPINLAATIARQPFKLVPEKLPIKMYRHAAKFSKLIPEKERIKVVKTALDENIRLGRGGLNTLQKKINNYNEEISKIVNRAKLSGQTIDVDDLYRGLETIKNEMKMSSDQPLVIERAFKNLKREWDANLDLRNVRNPAQVQKLKQNIYSDLKTLYEQHKASPAKNTFRQLVAKNAKESLENIIPEIKELNQKEGDLIDLYKAIEGRSNTITNADFFNFGLAMKMSVGGAIGSIGGKTAAATGAAAGIGLAILGEPRIHSKLAIVINNLRSKGIKIKNLPTLIRLGLYKEEEANSINEVGGS